MKVTEKLELVLFLPFALNILGAMMSQVETSKKEDFIKIIIPNVNQVFLLLFIWFSFLLKEQRGNVPLRESCQIKYQAFR